jgi:hypothetical protein
MNACDYWIPAYAGMTIESSATALPELNSGESKEHGF